MSIIEDTSTNDPTDSAPTATNAEPESTGHRAFLGSTGFVGSLAAMGGAAAVGTLSAQPARAQSARSSLNAIWRSEDVALLLIDYQPEMFASIATMNPRFMELNTR